MERNETAKTIAVVREREREREQENRENLFWFWCGKLVGWKEKNRCK